MEKKKKIAVLGLGYVGLPLAVSLSSSFKVIGFDISLNRVSQLIKGIDTTLEVKKEKLLNSQRKNLSLNGFTDVVVSTYYQAEKIINKLKKEKIILKQKNDEWGIKLIK